MELEKPKFWKMNILNMLVSISSFIALFGFWSKLNDLYKVLGITLVLVIILIVNMCVYCYNVHKFYNGYKKLYDNNNALIDNYKSNQLQLKQEEYNNKILRDFIKTTVSLLVVYGDLSKEERGKVKSQITEHFIECLDGGIENEKEI